MGKADDTQTMSESKNGDDIMSTYQSDTDKELEAVLGSHKTNIRIVGAGGAGNNTVTRLLEVGIKEVEVIAVNTDAQDLLFAKADHKILIGKSITNGLGAGSDPAKGEESAEESVEELENRLAGSDMVFITCGLGGGTGTGSAPVIAEVAKRNGALTIAVVTLPFGDEGVVRLENARKGLEQLHNHVDTVIVVQNDRLLDLVPDMPLNAAFKVADEILVNAVKGITELVTEKGLVNLDFADVRTIMESGGLAMIGLGESENEKAEEAAERALENPLLDVDITGAKSALINIAGGHELSLKSAKTIMKVVAQKLDTSAKIIWGARIDESMGSAVRVMLIVTCLQEGRRSSSEIEIALRKSDIKTGQAHQPTIVEASSAKSQPSQPSGVRKVAAKDKETRTGSQVFSDIFVEESEVDVVRLEEAVDGLSLGTRSSNERFLLEIKRACSTIHSSAELFGYAKIAEFLELIEDVTECAVKGEFDLSESLTEIFRQIPQTLRQMMNDDIVGFESADEIAQKLTNILQLLSKPMGDKKKPDDGQEKSDGNEVSATAAKTADKESSSDNNEKGDFSNVKEAVKYFDKLF